MSDNDLAEQLQDALHTMLGADSEEQISVVEACDDTVVYSTQHAGGQALFQRRYMLDERGAVTLGNPVAVQPRTVYEPVDDSVSDVSEREFSADTRRRMARAGTAMPDGSFPIANRTDLRNAIQAFGRARNKAQVKRHIIRRARALRAMDALPEEWTTTGDESAAVELAGDVVQLVERAVHDDGTVNIKLIAPGWGSSGYYSPEVLQTSAGVFNAGTHMFFDHPGQSEERDRPERSVRDLAGVLSEDATWRDDGPEGPGLYARAKLFSGMAQVLDEIAPHIGVSIRALGRHEDGAAEGRSGPIISEIVDRLSVDFVTAPGAGGQVIDLLENARSQKGWRMTEETTQAEQQRNEQNPARDAELASLHREVARLREVNLLNESARFVEAELAERRLPAMTRRRMMHELAPNPSLDDDGALDQDAFRTRIDEAVQAELLYLESVMPSGLVRGFGQPADDGDLEDEAFEDGSQSFYEFLGLSETAAKRAVAGR